MDVMTGEEAGVQRQGVGMISEVFLTKLLSTKV